MSINSIKNKLKKTSIKDTTWIKRAKFRKENKDWLDISFAIAVKIFSVLKANNLKPIKVVTLPTGLVCAHYSNGNIKVI
tara:strand:+ start:1947 stop:2183 length:237 start_codon:yes stop_codon:yes gene_type:complete